MVTVSRPIPPPASVSTLGTAPQAGVVSCLRCCHWALGLQGADACSTGLLPGRHSRPKAGLPSLPTPSPSSLQDTAL